jgi:hypothetical protein
MGYCLLANQGPCEGEDAPQKSQPIHHDIHQDALQKIDGLESVE